ncbi:MAG: ribonuclease III [Micrococcales bacterium]
MNLDLLGEKLGIRVEPQLLEQALTHRSFAYENGGIPNNERLEFLGDSVLGFVVTEHIFHTHTDLSEGELTKLKNSVVSEKALAHVARQLELGQFLRLGKGEEQTGGRDKASLLADAVEAILGAVLVSKGLPVAASLVERFIFPLLSDPDALRQASDPKTRLLEVAQAKKLGSVSYQISFEGPDHDRIFSARLYLADKMVSSATGKTKKAAETEAAIRALELIENS